MKAKKQTTKHLKNLEKILEVETVKDGFVLWVIETVVIKGKRSQFRHWLLDGSMVKKNGTIYLGSNSFWKIKIKYDEMNNELKIINLEKSKK